jgi:hypothetical protein
MIFCSLRLVGVAPAQRHGRYDAPKKSKNNIDHHEARRVVTQRYLGLSSAMGTLNCIEGVSLISPAAERSTAIR